MGRKVIIERYHFTNDNTPPQFGRCKFQEIFREHLSARRNLQELWGHDTEKINSRVCAPRTQFCEIYRLAYE